MGVCVFEWKKKKSVQAGESKCVGMTKWNATRALVRTEHDVAARVMKNKTGKTRGAL